jgi:hypothetical protein
MLARNATEITTVYPELRVFESPPKWMTQSYFDELSAEPSSMDVDLSPSGILEAVIAGRGRD